MSDDLLGQIDWQEWVTRFDRMQDRGLISRPERLTVLMRTVRAACPTPKGILDLGCGSGTLGEVLLDTFPDTTVLGVDLDHSLLALARRRLERFGSRVSLIRADLRDDAWMREHWGRFDAAVSATALHWLSAESLATLYRRLAGLLKPGGLFVNADHVANDSPAIMAAWLEDKKRHWSTTDPDGAETWAEFWKAYAVALGADEKSIGSWVVKNWEAVEEGMPMAWHFDRMRESGFEAVDCFWRSLGDAVYGGVRAATPSAQHTG